MEDDPPSARGHPALPTPKPCGERGLSDRCLTSTGSVGKGPPGLKLILSVTHSGTISPLQSATWTARRSGISPTTGLRLGWSKAASNQTTPEGQATRRLRVCSGALSPVKTDEPGRGGAGTATPGPAALDPSAATAHPDPSVERVLACVHAHTGWGGGKCCGRLAFVH